MRIVAGALRGRPLVAPAGEATRPTADRVRETLFSMLISRIGSFDDLLVADLFAGSGALGFEALSRGARRATFVETARPALAALRANAERLGMTDKTRIAAHDALRLPVDGSFDLIFADPPYAPGSGSAAVAAVDAAGWLAQGGLMAVETKRGDTVHSAWERLAERDVGSARLTVIRRPSPPESI